MRPIAAVEGNSMRIPLLAPSVTARAYAAFPELLYRTGKVKSMVP
jgi:hypothetical protein